VGVRRAAERSRALLQCMCSWRSQAACSPQRRPTPPPRSRLARDRAPRPRSRRRARLLVRPGGAVSRGRAGRRRRTSRRRFRAVLPSGRSVFRAKWLGPSTGRARRAALRGLWRLRWAASALQKAAGQQRAPKVAWQAWLHASMHGMLSPGTHMGRRRPQRQSGSHMSYPRLYPLGWLASIRNKPATLIACS